MATKLRVVWRDTPVTIFSPDFREHTDKECDLLLELFHCILEGKEVYLNKWQSGQVAVSFVFYVVCGCQLGTILIW